MRFLLLAVIVMLAALALGIMSPDKAKAQVVDLNIVTAIDTSGSITATEEDMQYRGLAQAVMSEEFIQRVTEGENGAVGFAVYTWASIRTVTVIPWTIIRNRSDALAVAAALDNIPRTSESSQYLPRPQGSPYIGTSTNIGESIETGVAMLEASPFTAERGVINILTDGTSDDSPSLGRALAAQRGITINGVVFGVLPDDLAAYFRENVITGVGAFVIVVEDPTDFAEPFERKFLQDMVAGLMQ